MDLDSHNSEIEHLGSGVTLEWLHERRIAILTVVGTTRDVVDTWANRAEQLVSDWSVGQTYAVIHDVSGAFLSPHARLRAQKFADMTRTSGLQGRYAVVVSNSLFGQTMRVFVNVSLRTRATERLAGQCFTSREQAIRWVVEGFA